MADKKSKSNVHTVINISMETETRQTVLTIDGVITPVTEFRMSKQVFDGEEFLHFSYTIEQTNPNGMVERRQFFLPDPTDAAVMATVDKRGFASKIVYNDEKAKADTIAFLDKRTVVFNRNNPE